MNNKSHFLSYVAVLAASIACYFNFKDYYYNILCCAGLGLVCVGLLDRFYDVMGYGTRHMPFLGEFCVLTLPASWIVFGALNYCATQSGSGAIFTFSLNTQIGVSSAAFFWVLANVCELISNILWHEFFGFKRFYKHTEYQQANDVYYDEFCENQDDGSYVPMNNRR